MIRDSSPTLTSSHAAWFGKLYNFWLSVDIKQGLYFTNCPDMIRCEQKIFDFSICILKIPTSLLKKLILVSIGTKYLLHFSVFT